MNLLLKAALPLLSLLCLAALGSATSRLAYYDAQGGALGTPITGTLNSIFTYSTSGQTIYAPRPVGTARAVITVLDEETLDRMVDVRVGILPFDLIFDGGMTGSIVPVPGFTDSQLIRLSTPTENTPVSRVLMVRGLGFGRSDTPYGVGLLVRSATFRFARVQVLNCVFKGFTVNAVYAQDPETELNISGCRFVSLDPAAGHKQIRFSGTSPSPENRIVTIQNCTFQVELQQPDALVPITGIYCYGQVNRSLYILNCRFEGFFANAIYASQLGWGNVHIIGSAFDGPRPISAQGLPHSMVRGITLVSVAEATVMRNQFRSVAECCIYLNDCLTANALYNTITDFGVTDGQIPLPSSFEIPRVNSRPWSESMIPTVFRSYYNDYPTVYDAERNLRRLYDKQTAIRLTGYGTLTSSITNNRIIRSTGMAIDSRCGDAAPSVDYRHFITDNLISKTIASSLRISTSNTAASGNTIVNAAIDPVVYQELLDTWGCDADGNASNFRELFQNSCFMISPGDRLIQHLLVSQNTIQRAGTCIVIDGDGEDSLKVPTGIIIEDNILDTVLQPYVSNFAVDGVCQDSIRMEVQMWRGIWVSDGNEVLIRRNHIHNGHVVTKDGEEWYVGGVGIQVDGSRDSEISNNVVDGVTSAIALVTYSDNPTHLQYMKNIRCTDNVFNNIHGYSLPAQTPGSTNWAAAFRLGIMNARIDTEVPTISEFTNIRVTDNLFIWNLDGDPTGLNTPAKSPFYIGFPLRGPFPACGNYPDPVHGEIRFTGNRGNLGGHGDLPFSPRYYLSVLAADSSPVCSEFFPGMPVADQDALFADLQAHNPQSVFDSDFMREDSGFLRTVSHPGFNISQPVVTLGGTESVPIVIPPYTTVTNP